LRFVDADTVNAALDPEQLVSALRAAFCGDTTVPLRHHHTIPGAPNGTDATLLLMPAWSAGTPPDYVGIKSVTVHPDNPARGLPSVQGVYLLLDGTTGTPVALIDGPALTARRTAAASALASTFLSRTDATHLLIIGTGSLAPELIHAHTATRPITRVSVCGRDTQKAQKLASNFHDASYEVSAVTDLAQAVRDSDIVSCATTSREPVFDGAWLTPGTHVDLVGGFRPDMREADDTAISRACVFVDTREGACREAGDITQPLAAGLLTTPAILADLFELCRGQHAGRGLTAEITLFKSVGTAIEDLAAAELLMTEISP
jgi:alanine dehydrogenase